MVFMILIANFKVNQINDRRESMGNSKGNINKIVI